MIEIVLTALGLGLFLSFSFGPVFFELINTSLRKGFKAAFLMETGVLFSDLVYLFLALFSAQKAIEYLEHYPNSKYIFGGIFFIFGIVSIIKNLKPSSLSIEKLNKPRNEEDTEEFLKNLDALHIPEKIKVNYIGNFMKGFSLNAINPAVLIFWISVCSTSIKSLDLNNAEILIFFSITLGMMFAIDILKIYFASRLQKYITAKFLQVIGICIGIIMIGAGLMILIYGIDTHPNGLQ
ncbi:MAG: threonine/homoserine/homoserine lactone efflux protein [Urechidicola sp.]|jgi:threonine/homoserine/homoserine lactone efflux protein|tara:strand:- start:996 stop:1706 length:711 start_codon:yes stop_codon:yes gene_type:complete